MPHPVVAVGGRRKVAASPIIDKALAGAVLPGEQLAALVAPLLPRARSLMDIEGAGLARRRPVHGRVAMSRGIAVAGCAAMLGRLRCGDRGEAKGRGRAAKRKQQRDRGTGLCLGWGTTLYATVHVNASFKRMAARGAPGAARVGRRSVKVSLHRAMSWSEALRVANSVSLFADAP